MQNSNKCYLYVCFYSVVVITDADSAGDEAKHKRTSEQHRQSKSQKHAGTKSDNAVTDYAAGLNGPKEQV